MREVFITDLLQRCSLVVVVALVGWCSALRADVTPQWPYSKPGDGLAVMQQVYFVNRHFAFDNLQIGSRHHPVRMILRHAERLSTGNTLMRSLNNRPSKATVRFQDKVVFPTGKVRGTAILVIGYHDRPASYSIWLPALRKVRRVSEPAHDDRWGGSPLTYGDIYFRKPGHEEHEILKERLFEGCLDVLEVPADAPVQKLGQLPQRDCTVDGTPVYVVRSTTRFDNWWYDYRLVYVDQVSFADYRSDYFKDGKPVKRIDKAWHELADSDPRAVMWRYWYARDMLTGQEGFGYVPSEGVLWNQQVKASQWTERALRKTKR